MNCLSEVLSEIGSMKVRVICREKWSCLCQEKAQKTRDAWKKAGFPFILLIFRTRILLGAGAPAKWSSNDCLHLGVRCRDGDISVQQVEHRLGAQKAQKRVLQEGKKKKKQSILDEFG